MECGEVIWKRGILRKGCGLCHGTAGNAYAFLSLYQLFMVLYNFPLFLLVLKEKPNDSDVNIYLFQARRELSDVNASKYLYRACVFAEWCFDLENHREMLPDRPYSLYEGLAGIVYYLIDLLVPADAAFPGYSVHSI